MKRGEYAKAVAVLRPAGEKAPRSAVVQRQLGIALYMGGEPGQAVSPLKSSRDIQPRSRPTQYFLGASAEASGDSALALQAYRDCLAIGGGGLGPVRARADALARAEMHRAIVQALRAEGGLPLPAENTLAVPEFELSASADSLRPLCRGLSVLLMLDLHKVPQLSIVERERLPVLMQELALSRARSGGLAVVDSSTAPRYGRLMGARRFAQGNVLPLTASGNGRLELRVSVFEVETGLIRGTGAPVSGRASEVLKLEKQLVYEVLDSLGVEVDASVRRAIGVPVTRSYAAFMALCRGLEFESRGLATEASTEYREALRRDPGFTLVQERLDVTAANPQELNAMERVLLLGDTGGAESGASDRVQRSDEALGFGPTDRPDPAAGSTASVDQPSRLRNTGQGLPKFPNPPRAPARP